MEIIHSSALLPEKIQISKTILSVLCQVFSVYIMIMTKL